MTGDILEPLVTAATNVIDATGLAGVFLLMALESACVPIPSEATMLFAGFSVSEGNLTLFGIVAAGVLGNLVGSLVAYAVGYYGRIELLDRNRLIHISRRQLESADRWFERHGPATVFFTRMLPVIRTFISLPAGVARMPLGKFVVYTLAGCIPWVLGLAILGREVGSRWDQWKNHLHYFDYAVVAAVVIAVIYLIVRRRRGSTQWETTPPA
jgi:membrane protein DedA with SNARE-associated domain